MLNTKELILEKIKLVQGDSIKAKSTRGIIKLGFGTGVERTLRLVRTMILTRILVPDEFGLMAMVLILVNVFEQLSEVGIKLAVVQNKRGTEPEFLNATWWFQVVRGLGLFAFSMLAAPWLCAFCEKPYLLKYLQVALVVLIFRGFISPRAHALRREYKFGLMIMHIQGSALIGTIVTVISAFAIRNLWALIIGYLAENISLFLLSYIIAPFKPRFGIDRSCLKELMKFARGMFGLPILTLIGYTAPTFVLGKVVSDEMLGLYALAGQFINIPLNLFSQIISPVLLPGFARKQDDKVALNKIVLKLSGLLAAANIPLVVYIMVCAPGLMYFLWGPQYVDATIPCIILSLLIIIRTQGPILSSVYVAVGKPYLQRNFTVLQTLIIIACIYPAVVRWGFIGAALTSITGGGVALFMQVFWCRRVIPLKYGDYVKCYIPGLLMAFVPVITIRLMLLLGIDSLLIIIAAGLLLLLVTYVVYYGVFLLLRKNPRRSFVPNLGIEKVCEKV